MENSFKLVSMKTKVLQISEVEEAVTLLRSGNVVAFPTETVYGLAAPIFAPKTIQRIFEVKGRPSDNPLIAHISNFEQLAQIVQEVPPAFNRIAEAFFPGPLTIVMQKHPDVPLIATAGLGTVGVRMPNHPVALELIEALGEPVVAPSANRSGLPSSTEVGHVLDDFDGKIGAVLDGGPCAVGLESTVLSLLDPEHPIILRPGAVTKEQLEGVLEIEVKLASSSLQNATPPSPGMKYRHYAPRAKVRLFSTWEALLAHMETSSCFHKILASDPEACALKDVHELSSKDLFRHFRLADSEGVEEILVLCDSSIKENAALMNRLEKACEINHEEGIESAFCKQDHTRRSL